MRMRQRKNKYNAVKTGKSASKKEARRKLELEAMEAAGEISDLRCQVPFVVIPTQREHTNEKYTKGWKKGCYKPGKLLARQTVYIADFVYNHAGKMVVEDVKGYRRGPAYDLFTVKRKLMLYRYGIRVQEV